MTDDGTISQSWNITSFTECGICVNKSLPVAIAAAFTRQCTGRKRRKGKEGKEEEEHDDEEAEEQEDAEGVMFILIG